jgi:hypothetical protein
LKSTLPQAAGNVLAIGVQITGWEMKYDNNCKLSAFFCQIERFSDKREIE